MVFSLKLKNLIQPTYQSENLVKEFYEPVLSEATIYRRVSAYFSSEGLGLYSKGLDKLFGNNGFAKFIISTDISEEDFKNINKTTQDILDNKFPKIPYNHNICGICEFKNYCWGLE